MANTINIDDEKLNELFPFYIIIDKNLNIKSVGRSFKKLVPDAINHSFQSLFKIKRPNLEEINFESLLSCCKNVVLIRVKTKSNLILRGQFLYFESDDKLLFAGFPFVTNSEELNHHHLLLSDFAIHNTITDLVQITKSNEIVMEDIRHLVTNLQEQKSILNSTSTRLSALIKNLQSGVLLEDQHRKIVLVNQTFCDIFGIPVNSEHLIGADCRNSAEESKSLFSDPETFVKDINKLLLDKKTVVNEILHLKDGRILERDFIPVYAENEYQGHLWQYRDVTEEKNIQRQIKLDEEKYKRIIENFELGLIEVDTNDIITKVYPRFCVITGYDEKELLGKNSRILLVDDKDLKILESQNEKRRKGETSVYEVRIRRKDGSITFLLISGAPIYDVNDNVIGSIGIHWDISLRKEKEEELRIAKEQAENSVRIKQQFLANMSHEIRTPMNIIMGLTDLLSETNLNSNQKKDLNIIKDSAEHLLTIINDILDISKIESGKVSLQNNIFNPKELILKLTNQFKILADKKGLSFTVSLENNLPELIMGDEYRLNQVLSNLISNGIKFTKQGGVTFLIKSVQNSNNQTNLIFKISDTGIGISNADQKIIFESFTQATNASTREFGGTGLGLSIVKELVKLQNGTITINSEINAGTEFIIEIPFSVTKSKDENTIAIQTQINSWQLKGLKILLVEDNEFNQLIVNRNLLNWGVACDIANNGQEAVNLFQLKDYDLILMDIQIPILDGNEVTRFIRHISDPKKSVVPIIGLSAHALNGKKEECLDAGMNDYITKPFKPEELFRKILLHSTNQPNVTNNIINLNYLKEISTDNSEFFKISLEHFILKTPILFNQLKTALIDKNLKDYKFYSHKIRSSFKIIGATKICIQIENIESDFNNTTNQVLFSEIENQFTTICDLIKQEITILV